MSLSLLPETSRVALRPTLTLTAIVALSLATGLADASWTASGSFSYTDREYDQNGFTGVEPARPVRFADIEVVDANLSGKRSVLATGATDGSGSFSVFVPDNSTRSVYVRVISTSSNVSDLNQDVRQNTGGKTVNYAAATATISGHDPGTNHDFGTTLLAHGSGAEVFNIYDQMLVGADYVASLAGARPGSSFHLATVWGLNNGVSDSFYDTTNGRIVLRDTAGFDDTVILHEMGHHIIRKYSATTAPNAAHTFSMCNLDIQQAFEEGWASYFGNSSLRHHGVPVSNIYTRTDGGPGAGHLVRYADLETDTQYLCQGSSSELVVASLLWDIADGPSTPDTTPGVDDPGDGMDLDDSETWEVMTTGLPGRATISLEDFWDTWFLPPIQNGMLPEMIALATPLSIEYFEDDAEVNDDAPQAGPVATDGSPIHASLFRDVDQDGAGGSDLDFYSFNASAGQSYQLETLNLINGADTSLRLYDTDGASVLALNDDRSSGDPSSLLTWTAPRTDQFFARVHAAVSPADYGSYDLRVAALVPTDDDGDGYDTGSDCDDTDPNINPGAVEVCDGVDQDCDGTVDNGFDGDEDLFTTCSGDCNDGNASVNPGVDEVPSNGIDDNCNGEIDEVTSTDLVTIIKAQWKKGPKKLTVEATSDQQPGVALTVVGFGPMSWDATLLRYIYNSPNGTPNPGTVTVESTGGGSDTAAVQ
jgi:hypothetical protein